MRARNTHKGNDTINKSFNIDQQSTVHEKILFVRLSHCNQFDPLDRSFHYSTLPIIWFESWICSISVMLYRNDMARPSKCHLAFVLVESSLSESSTDDSERRSYSLPATYLTYFLGYLTFSWNIMPICECIFCSLCCGLLFLSFTLHVIWCGKLSRRKKREGAKKPFRIDIARRKKILHRTRHIIHSHNADHWLFNTNAAEAKEITWNVPCVEISLFLRNLTGAINEIAIHMAFVWIIPLLSSYH